VHLQAKIITLILGLLMVIPMASAKEGVMRTSFCHLVRHPGRYKGKMVEFRSNIKWGLAVFSASEDCKDSDVIGIWIAYPEGVRDRRVPFELVRDNDFRLFDDYMSAELPPTPGVFGPRPPRRYCKITVTLTGLFEAVSEEEALRGRAFGHLGWFQFRLILRRVVNPVAEECPPLKRSLPSPKQK
jgi:hypothetical protein